MQIMLLFYKVALVFIPPKRLWVNPQLPQHRAERVLLLFFLFLLFVLHTMFAIAITFIVPVYA